MGSTLRKVIAAILSAVVAYLASGTIYQPGEPAFNPLTGDAFSNDWIRMIIAIAGAGLPTLINKYIPGLGDKIGGLLDVFAKSDDDKRLDKAVAGAVEAAKFARDSGNVPAQKSSAKLIGELISGPDVPDEDDAKGGAA